MPTSPIDGGRGGGKLQTRLSLDWLLARYPNLDLVSLDWQIDPADERQAARWKGPWLLVELGEPSDHFELAPAWALWRFAIWRTTGAVHRLGFDGAVDDDPVYSP